MIMRRIAFLLAVAFFVLTAGVGAAQYKEAPQLAELVRAGKLPPVEERLPQEPLVVEVVEEIGQYGGTWRRAALGQGDIRLRDRLTYENLIRWSMDGSDVVPNIAKSWDISEDGRVFTFYLRKGIRWSDGHPFTADDLEFWWKDVIMNQELSPVVPGWLVISGKPAEFTKIDQYTIRFEFVEPYGSFLRQMAHYGYLIGQYPKHYLKQFHANYVSKDELTQQAQEAGLEMWHQLFSNKQNTVTNPEIPVILAWKTKRITPSEHIAERNPYYWKVDAEGNQLPYIDTVRHDLVANAEVLNLKAASGEIDMQLRHIMWGNLPVFVENSEKHNLRILHWPGEASNALLFTNPYHTDPVMKKLLRDVRFRKALSLAIDRNEINELAYLGLGYPTLGGVVPQSPYYVPGADKKYIERDIDEANRLLDELGLTKRDEEGYRMRPDGNPLVLTVPIANVFGPWTVVGELLVDYWSEVGLRATIDVLERSLLTERLGTFEWDISIWTNDYALTPDVDATRLLPTPPYFSAFGPWHQWFETGGARGEAPPEGSPERRAYELYEQARTVPDPERRVELMKELVELNSEQLWNIGTVGGVDHVVIVKKNFRNVPEKAHSDWLQLTPGNTWPEQYFWRK